MGWLLRDVADVRVGKAATRRQAAMIGSPARSNRKRLTRSASGPGRTGTGRAAAGAVRSRSSRPTRPLGEGTGGGRWRIARRCLPEVSVILRSRTAAAYGRTVPTAVSVFSNTQVPPQQIAWLLNQFDSLQGPSGQSWIIDVGPDVTDVVAVADGTDDLASMPRELIDAAAEWLGDPPQYRLALTIGDSPACRDLAWRIANEFARWWPAVWSNHDSTEPAAPLGT